MGAYRNCETKPPRHREAPRTHRVRFSKTNSQCRSLWSSVPRWLRTWF